MLRTIIHYKKYDLLKHPLCEMFLHLKWKRAHGLYYLVKLIHIFFTLLVVFYTLVYHGELKEYGIFTNCDPPTNQNTSFLDQDTETRPCSNAIFLPIIITVISFLLLMMHSTKIFQNRHSFDWSLIREYILEDGLPLMSVVLFVINHAGFFWIGTYDVRLHRGIAGFLVLVSCHSMAYTNARDSDNAIFVEMMFKIIGNLFRFLMSYIWLFIGWFTAFHVVMGSLDAGENKSSFRDLGSAMAKTVSMFTGDLGFENGFVEWTNFEEYDWFAALVLFLYILFTFEMSVVLMNQLIGLAICNIQELAEDADGLRLVKEVMFQKYMESLLHILPSLPSMLKRGQQHKRLGQLVTKDIYNGNAIYCVDQDSFESGCYTLQLNMKTTSFLNNNFSPTSEIRPMSRDMVSTIDIKTIFTCNIPGNVVNKLKCLIHGNEQKTKEKEEMEQKQTLLMKNINENVESITAIQDKVNDALQRSELLFKKLEVLVNDSRISNASHA